MRGPNSRSILQNRSHIGEVSKGFDIRRFLYRNARVELGGNVFMPGQVMINGNPK